MSAVPLKKLLLGDLLQPISTCNPGDDTTNELFRYVDLSAIDQESKSITGDRVVPISEAPSRARQLIRAHDVLVSTVRPNLNAVALVPERLNGAIASTGFSVLRANQKLLASSYLFHWVRGAAFISEMVRRATGASYPAVSDRIVHESVIPLPPLEEQRRIAAILDKAEALQSKRRQALAKLDTLTQSLFLEMFGDPTTNQRGWYINRLGELGLEVTDIDHKMPRSIEEGVPFISAKELLDDGTISFEDVKKISQEDFDRLVRKSRPKRGDIIYSRIGVNLGKARLVEVDFDFLASYSCCTIKPNLELMDPLFLCSFLDSPFALRQAHNGTKAIAVPDLGLNEIKNFRIPVPPMKFQRAFRRRIELLAVLRNSYRASNVSLKGLSSSLQYRAFRGEL